MSKLLQYWGLGDRLKEKAIQCPKIEFRDGELLRAPRNPEILMLSLVAASGERLSTVVYHPALIRELEAEQYGVNVRFISTQIATLHG